MGYYFKNNQFVIENYDKQKTFSSFLPGVAGIKGIPMWSFYANRGQGMTSFGIKDKDEPILEFFPANTGYQYVDRYGFRSFVRVDGEWFEPFSVSSKDEVVRKMYISRGHFAIEEINETRGIEYKVTYFGLPNEPLAGIARMVEVKNTSAERNVDVVDGIATVLPTGTTNGSYKEMSNLMRSWMDVFNQENNIPFYKFRASSGDEAEVSMIEKGHFYLSIVNDRELIKPIVDQKLVFGYDTSLSVPSALVGVELNDLDLDNQVTVNKVPCGFTPASKTLKQGETLEVKTLIGHVSDVDIINQKAEAMASHNYFNEKFAEAEQVIDELVNVVETESNFPMFDAYMKQNYLDNTLRGGFPLIFGDKENPKVYHVFSRKHGDPERDYNFFSLAPEFYSQGNGNFRDVNQNRRSDVLFVPEAGLYNVKTFMNLVQLDGYNPLGVHGTTFTIDADKVAGLVDQYVRTNKDLVSSILSGKFTPGQISMAVLLNDIELKDTEENMINDVLSQSTQHIEANFGEGFWVDHWTYNYDLIENYLSIYPDKVNELLFEDKSYQYFESPVSVLPRSKKYGLTKAGVVRQYGSIEEEEHSARFDHANWSKTETGETYETNLAQKLLTLVLTKFSSLDPFGMGIEMEANKPGWNDAMNGLPGVLGSGVSETIELVRVVRFFESNLTQDIEVLEENKQFFDKLVMVLSKDLSLFDRWDEMTSIREAFRDKIKHGISGTELTITKSELSEFLRAVEVVLLDGIRRAKEHYDGVVPTFMTYSASEYDVLDEKTPYGLTAVNVKAFEIEDIPYFLEGPARSLKVFNKDDNKALFEKIKKTDVYDHKLNTYKTSAKLDEMSYELGRVRAFTPGWLERESNFLHMTYKYILGLLKGGLYEEFYEEIKTNLVCFMDPSVYGRSTLENSSFIASSFNPDPSVHGQGFVARLSGSTAEMLSIWQMMMFGKHLFTMEDELSFTPSPKLHTSFFKDGVVKTRLLSSIEFVIKNDTDLPTYSNEVEVSHYVVDGNEVPTIKGDLALKVRNREVKSIEMIYKTK
jgi:hypothetical protein